MTYNLIITTTAEQNAMDACTYYEEQLAGLSERFLNELEIAYQKIAEHPQYYGFISANDNYRDIRLHKFPYVVIYEIDNDSIIVVAIFNTHRKPLY